MCDHRGKEGEGSKWWGKAGEEEDAFAVMVVRDKGGRTRYIQRGIKRGGERKGQSYQGRAH